MLGVEGSHDVGGGSVRTGRRFETSFVSGRFVIEKIIADTLFW